ncbi:hypothetical protein PGT21_025266 [Puccinia graminis f. sp. tritici]|uniref:Uncharacterized protein n=1 Tax=Puccinia graminis f. sp. tritici TaxID=56615 RepID=A0A5B0R1N6_PUCGR|nr:hypothetical protein PGTUg99_002938 [Puccinia graminis f. sp. tritici]KAA1078728.1 hypothetical protein PGTUg99_003047 [Puccinia graminis f. sp. tritici]KAA1084001.1 hypothetical protein PGT21_013937 [Puccinia graminis f. sp. tritici]KAA1119426.1 hypothetical protein PGT21_025266 [Puccinia graminis f. sp. tritici]
MEDEERELVSKVAFFITHKPPSDGPDQTRTAPKKLSLPSTKLRIDSEQLE